MGRERTRVEVSCARCGKACWSHKWQLTSGRPRYCSRECYQASRFGNKRGPYAENKIVEDRICPVCRGLFQVGGRGRPPKHQVVCSDVCQRASRYRRGAKAKELSTAQAAYLAGFMDGEGSIILYWRRSVALKIVFSNTNKDALNWITETSGVGAVFTKDRTPEKHKTSHWFQANSEAAESLLRQIRPYLIIKAKQADLAIETQERLRVPALKADRAWQEEYRQRMKALNQRGPQISE